MVRADELLAQVEVLRADSAQAMSALTGDTSACTRAKNGESFPAYKFHEGRTAAFGELARALRKAEPEVRADGLVEELHGRWRAEQELRAEAGRDWQAYAAGGVDAAETVSAALTRGEETPLG